MNNKNRTPKGHMGNTIKFSSESDKQLFLKDFNSKSILIGKFNTWKYLGNYKNSIINFKEVIIAELIKKGLVKEKEFYNQGGKLEKLHLCLNDDKKNLDESEQNQVSVSFYETSIKLREIYIEFIKSIISPHFDDDLYFQDIPTFRFHFPNQRGYEWNDRYHTDIMLGHPPYEINIWLPFTRTYGSNSMRIMSFENSKAALNKCNYNFEVFAEKVQYDDDFASILKSNSYPIEMNYGEYIMFDPRCLHCTQNNTTNDTRISMDIRVITKNNLSKYSRDYRSTGRQKMLFTPGNYFYKSAV